MTPLLLSLLLAVSPVVPDGGTVVAKGQRFLAEVARTPQEQALGLMHRQSLAKDRCMIFIYPEEGNRSIWMKNCLISLDVTWVKEDGTIVETAEAVPPCSPMRGDDCPTYGGAAISRNFVEFPSGTIRRLGLRKGDRLGWHLALSDGSTVTGGVPVPADSTKGRKKRK
jgi:uncharacterized membrane protein (UPF0127 family)